MFSDDWRLRRRPVTTMPVSSPGGVASVTGGVSGVAGLVWAPPEPGAVEGGGFVCASAGVAPIASIRVEAEHRTIDLTRIRRASPERSWRPSNRGRYAHGIMAARKPGGNPFVILTGRWAARGGT